MTSQTGSDLLERARAWAAEDPDDQTRAELEAVLAAAESGDEAATADLADRFAGTLEFGTAGLRGALGAGPNRMNRIVVIRAAAGLAAYLRANGAADGDAVVIGFDARHNSDVFARDTAEVMTGAGLRALVMPRPLPTPLLAFAIRELGCVAGVEVTASHNPPQDNGYKVYLGDGSQIVPPADAEIAARIDAVGALADVPRGDGGEVLDDGIIDAYLTAVGTVAADGPRDLTLVYTPLHGVGNTSVLEVLDRAGFAAPHVVPEQQHPDPDFPTVAFPNPEEPGAMDLAMALASQVGADLVVANDPDADRCAAAVEGPHGWRMLRGDEVGALLGDHLLRSGKQGVYARLDRVLLAARQARRCRGSGVRRDAHRLQVDRPGAGARLRLRGGARLLRRPGAREGQGRRLGAADALRHRGPRQGRGPHADRPARRHRGPARPARHRPAVRAGGRPLRDPGRDGPAPRDPAGDAGRPRRARGRRPQPRLRRCCRPPTACATASPTAPG